MNTFYMIFNVTTQGAIRATHDSLEKAKIEATRLACTCPTQQFAILKSEFMFTVKLNVVEERIL